MKTNYHKLLCGLLIVGAMSCSRMNDLHDQYLKDGEIIYTGKVDSAKVLAGENRLVLRYYTSDPKAKNLLIYWNLRTEQKQVEIPDKNIEDPVDVDMDMEEGTYFFELFTMNENMQNLSVPCNVEGNVYGSIFQGSLLNRNIISVVRRSEDRKVLIRWYGVDPKAIGCEIKYLNQNGVVVDDFVASANEFVTEIPDVSEEAEYIEYRTVYLPEPDALDKFYSAFRRVDVEKEQGEEELEKSLFRRWNPAGLPYHVVHGGTGGSFDIENLWDGIWLQNVTDAPPGRLYAAAQEPLPYYYITFDMGQEARLTRFKIHNRSNNSGRNALVYGGGHPRKFELWGSATPNVTAEFDTWQFLGYFESVRPVDPQEPSLGDYVDTPRYATNEEVFKACIEGEDYFIEDSPPVRYIRFQQIESWGSSPLFPVGAVPPQMVEMTFWGLF